MIIQNLAAQLYTVRSLCQTPAETASTLKKIQAIGFTSVEVAGICPIESSELKMMIDDTGLSICALHGAADEILHAQEKVIERMNVLQCEYAVYSYPAGFDLGKTEDVRRLVQELATAGAAFRAAGKTLCYHHHSLEFGRYELSTVLEYIMGTVDSADLSIELDTYWVQHGGGSPVDWCTQMKNRLPILHLKDYGCIAGTPTMMEVGRGNLDWEKIIPAASASGCQWFVVEQDTCPGCPLDSLKISYEYISSDPIRPLLMS